MGDHHRPTGGTERSGSSTIAAPRQQERVSAPAPAPRIADTRKDTGNRAKAASTPAPKTQAPQQSPHQKVGPAAHAGSSKIAPAGEPKVLDQVFTNEPAPKRIEAAPTVTAAPQKHVETTVLEEVGTTKAKLIALLGQIAGEEPNYPKEGSGSEKKARAAWMAKSLAALARAVLNKRPKEQELAVDANARNQLIHDLRKPLEAQLGSTPVTKPRFLG